VKFFFEGFFPAIEEIQEALRGEILIFLLEYFMKKGEKASNSIVIKN